MNVRVRVRVRVRASECVNVFASACAHTQPHTTTHNHTQTLLGTAACLGDSAQLIVRLFPALIDSILGVQDAGPVRG